MEDISVDFDGDLYTGERYYISPEEIIRAYQDAGFEITITRKESNERQES